MHGNLSCSICLDSFKLKWLPSALLNCFIAINEHGYIPSQDQNMRGNFTEKYPKNVWKQMARGH